MAANISAWLVPVLLVVACMALVINIFHTKKVNSTLVADIESGQADLQIAADSSQECSKKLEAKNAEMTSKDQQVASLTANMNTLTEEKTKLEEQVTQLTAQLEQANATSTAMQAEKEKLEA